METVILKQGVIHIYICIYIYIGVIIGKREYSIQG